MSFRAYQPQKAQQPESRADSGPSGPSFSGSPGFPGETDLEAQVEKASRYGHSLGKLIAQRKEVSGKESSPDTSSSLPLQRKVTIQGGEMLGEYATKSGKGIAKLIGKLKDDPRSNDWKRGWVKWLQLKAQVSTNEDFADLAALADAIHAKFDQPKSKVARPNFPSSTYTLAKGVHSLRTGTSQQDISLADEDLAVPHRMPYADLKDNLDRFTSGAEDATTLTRWTDRLATATRKRKAASMAATDADDLLPSSYSSLVDKQLDEFSRKRRKLVDEKNAGTLTATSKSTLDFLSSLNSLHGNVPDLGPHTPVNIPVSDRGHPNIASDGSMSPGTEAMVSMSPGRLRKGIAVTSDGQSLVTPHGSAVPLLTLPKAVQDKLKKHSLSTTTIDADDLD